MARKSDDDWTRLFEKERDLKLIGAVIGGTLGAVLPTLIDNPPSKREGARAAVNFIQKLDAAMMMNEMRDMMDNPSGAAALDNARVLQSTILDAIANSIAAPHGGVGDLLLDDITDE